MFCCSERITSAAVTGAHYIQGLHACIAYRPRRASLFSVLLPGQTIRLGGSGRLATMLGPVSAAPKTYTYPGPASIAQAVLDRCTIIHQPFTPTPWALNGHAQSALGVLRTATARGSYTRQPVLANDGGTLGLDWWNGADRQGYAPGDAPICLFIHGVNGGSHEGYVKWACVAAAQRGWRAVVLNLRGCNGLDVSSPRGYNALQTHDVHVALTSVARRFPSAPLFAVGYSLGSVLLAKYLAEADSGLHGPSPVITGAARAAAAAGATGAAEALQQGSPGSAAAAAAVNRWSNLSGSGLVAAALVSAPVCLHCTNSKLARARPSIMYNFAVAYKLREYVREHLPSLAIHGVDIDSRALDAIGWTLGSFDDAITLKQLGYEDAQSYYRHACSTNYIPLIRTPTLVLVSRDDPFLGFLPKDEVASNPFVALAATKRGGHLGFLQGRWPLGLSYADLAVDDFLASALELAEADGGCSWEERAVQRGWVPPDDRQQRDTAFFAHARCNCLARHWPDIAAEQEAASSASVATGPSGRVGGKVAGDGRWRLDDILKEPPPPGWASKWLGLGGGSSGGSGSGFNEPSKSGRGRRKGSNPSDCRDGSTRAIAVPSVTLEVPSPTLEQPRAPPPRLLGAAAQVPRSKL